MRMKKDLTEDYFQYDKHVANIIKSKEIWNIKSIEESFEEMKEFGSLQISVAEKVSSLRTHINSDNPTGCFNTWCLN